MVFDVTVRIGVRVELDETKFTPEFMAEFRRHFYSDYHDLSDHAEHIACLVAAGDAPELDQESTYFFEGYGPVNDMGILAEITDTETEIADN